MTIAIDAAALPDSVRAQGKVGVRGDTPPLAWDRSTPLLDDDGDGVYTGTLDFPEGTGPVAYKAVLEGPGANVAWEPGDNRLLMPGRMAADRRAFGAPQADLPVLTVSRQQLREDLGVLQNAIGALHPGLFLHNTPAEVEAVSNRLRAEARALGAAYGEAIPMPQVYLAVSKAVAGLRDGHTKVSMYNQGAYLAAVLYGRPDRVPFTFRLVEGRMIVTGDATPGAVLPRGTEILSLDGRPAKTVVDALLPYASADGDADGDRLHRLEVNALPAPAERFDVTYALLFEPEGDLPLRVRLPDGTETTRTVARTTQDARRAALQARDASFPRSDGDLFRLRVLDDGTALLRIGTFATFSLDIDYGAWLTDAFRQIRDRDATRLVVDLRGNAGGMTDAAVLLLRHLLTEGVEVTPWDGVTAYQTVPPDVRPHVRSWSSEFYDLTGRVTPAGDGTFRMAPRPRVRLEPAPDAFDGPVAVLVDAAASSATFLLADQIQKTGAALLVGQETGGSLRGLNAGQVMFLTLPHTGLVVDLPLIGSRPPGGGRDGGVVPDVLVTPDADAVVAGRDPELEAATSALTSR